MEGGENHLQSGAILEFRVGIDGDAAPIIAHVKRVGAFEADLNHVGKTGDRFIHRIIDDLGSQVMIGRIIRAANIHAGAPTHRLQPL
ncbi:hypothetical protein CGLAMM_04630 [Acetobacteraceae bacterium EV16G]